MQTSVKEEKERNEAQVWRTLCHPPLVWNFLSQSLLSQRCCLHTRADLRGVSFSVFSPVLQWSYCDKQSQTTSGGLGHQLHCQPEESQSTWFFLKSQMAAVLYLRSSLSPRSFTLPLSCMYLGQKIKTGGFLFILVSKIRCFA